MLGDEEFQQYMERSHTISTSSRVVAEWNLNIIGNIHKVGNYEVRNGNVSNESDNATSSHTVISSQYYDPETDNPIQFVDGVKKMEMLYSLDECVSRNRPRSGINKPLYLGYTGSDVASAQYINNYGEYIMERPRYYMGSRYDTFKYWTSYRVDETGEERGISREDLTIDDVAPFVKYKNAVPANRVVVKMQTNVGTKDLGSMRYGDDVIPDPLYGMDKATIPAEWRIDLLEDGVWNTKINLSQDDIAEDGYVEIGYGRALPEDAYYQGEMPSFASLPVTARRGDTYWCELEQKFYQYKSPSWIAITPQDNWFRIDPAHQAYAPVAQDLMRGSGEYQMIEGIRVVVTSMINPNNSFDLIEMSPRFVADLTDRATAYSVIKILSDMGNGSLPTGRLLASTGTISLSNNDAALSYENQFSVLSILDKGGNVVDNAMATPTKITFQEVVKDVKYTNTSDLGKISTYVQDTYIPIKTFYTTGGLPQAEGSFDVLELELRDYYSWLESQLAPELFLPDVSLSFAITMLLDHIGFTNVKYYRMDNEQDDIIPFFFVPPNMNVAQVLEELAAATQCAIWFDERNDLCVATREWLMSQDRKLAGTLKSDNEDGSLPNIISLSSEEKRVSNTGSVNYTERYIQREYGELKQAYNTNQWKTWIYKPVLLWEAAPDTLLKDYNTTAKTGSSYTLSAIPLSEDLTADVPTVLGEEIINNTMEFGEGIAWLGHAQGYFYANGEIIRFDAMQFAVSGLGVVWIENNDEYQDYFARVPFNGKIYATGKVRIYAEANYNANGKPISIKAHGRGQFGTEVTSHTAGLNEYWKNNDNCFGLQMDSSYLFSADHIRKYPLSMNHPNITMNQSVRDKAAGSTKTGIMKNFLADKYQTENENLRFNTTNRGTVQSSAFIFQGPKEFEDRGSNQAKTADNITYMLKDFGNEAPYKHFGTRCRIVGEFIAGSNTKQKAVGAGEYVTIVADDPSETVNITGGGGGLGIMVDPITSNGYFMEIVAFSEDTNPKSVTNPVFNSTVKMTPDRGTSKVVISTGQEHNIEDGEKFVVTYSGADASLQALRGEWKAESVDKENGKINIRITGEYTYNGGETVKVQATKSANETLSNLFFYKMMEKDGEIIPYVLWEGIGEILVDEGKFVDSQRLANNTKETVYDIGIEYKDKSGVRTFYLYLNGKQIGTVDDSNPIPNPRNTMCLFNRGKTRMMFNNFYALAERLSENPASAAVSNIAEAFGADSITQSESLRKYGVSGFVQQAYLSGIRSESAPEYQMYFDEFGTIMRECDYLKVKYDKAYPALVAQIAPVITPTKGYTVSGFYAGAYGAEFLVFNHTDTALTMDASTGNFLRILGVTFTQDTTKVLDVDDYFGKVADMTRGNAFDTSALEYKEMYNKVIESRNRYGVQEFDQIASTYIQDDSQAENVLGWIIDKTMRPRKLVGMEVFGMPHMQLGDQFNISYNVDGIDVLSDPTKRFVTYQMEYAKSDGGIMSTVAYMVEV